MAARTITWVAGAVGDWTTAANWVGDAVPTAGDVVEIGSSLGDDAYIAPGESEAVAGLLLGLAGAFGGLDVVGTLTLAGVATITLGELSVGGSVNFGGHGGEIVGGTLDFAGGSFLTYAPGTTFESGHQVAVPGGTLDAVTLVGTFDTSTEISCDVIGGLTLPGATVDLSDSAPIFVGDQTLTAHTIENAILTVASGTLTLPAGVVAAGAFIVNTGGGVLVNDGLIDATAFDDDSQYGSGALTNNGTILTSGTTGLGVLVNTGSIVTGSSADLSAGGVVNSGLLQIGAGGTFGLTGGNVSQDSLGTIALGAGATLLLGLIDGGVITSAGAGIGGAATLQNVTLVGDTTIPAVGLDDEVSSVTVVGTLSFAGATAGTPGSLDLGYKLTFVDDATLANVALTLVGGGSAGLNGDGATLSGDAGLTLAATTAITFAPAVGTPGVFGPAITAATSLTLDGSIGGYAGGQVDITAGSGDWVNNGTISTVAGEFLEISTGGTFGGTGKLSLVSGSFLDVASNISAAGFDQFTPAAGAGIGLAGNLTGGSAPGDSTVTIPVGTSFSASFRSTLKDVTIDANGTVGSIAATLDAVTWRGVALDVENTAETDVEGGLVVTSADGGTGTIDLGGTNSILAILDSETLDNVAIDIGSSSTTPASDSISVLSARGASITFGAESTVNLVGNNAFNGIVANHASAYGTFDVDTNAPNFGTPTGTIPFIGVSSFFNNGLLSVGQSVAAADLQTSATGGATHSYDDTLLFCKNIEGSVGTLETFDIVTYLKELDDFYISSPLGTSPFGGGKLTLAPAAAPASAAGISAATLAADETTIDGTGTIAIASIGSFFDAEIAASQHIVFAGPHAEVGFGEPGGVQAAISNFGSLDGIDLALDGYVGGSVSYANGVLMVPTAAGSISLTLAFATGVSAADVLLADDGEGGTAVYVACFAKGTRIATARGAVAVERLRSGDHVRTASGRLRPVLWTGHRRIDCARHPRPHDVLPVRVRAHAFGDGMPTDDVRLSPDHAVLIDGVLIPVRYLLNDTTIVQADAGSVTYWHVELDAHDVLLAHGLPCESYLDTGNRSAFAGCPALQLHPDFSNQALDIWHSAGCAPLVRDGAELETARSYLLERAEALGHVASADARLHLLADGVPLAPAFRDGIRYSFTLRRPVRRLRLISRAAVPARMVAYHPDHRRLGVMVVDAAVNGVALDLAALGDGWHATEQDPGTVWRWTDGDAALPARDTVTVEIAAVSLPTGYPCERDRRNHEAASGTWHAAGRANRST